MKTEKNKCDSLVLELHLTKMSSVNKSCLELDNSPIQHCHPQSVYPVTWGTCL